MTVFIVILIVYAAFHVGHARSNYKHGRAMGKRGIALGWYSGRGPWVSVPIPGMRRTRITHRFGRR